MATPRLNPFFASFELGAGRKNRFQVFGMTGLEIENSRPARGLVVSAPASVLVGREFGRVLPRPCKLVLQPSYKAHGMRKSCREHTQNTKSIGEK